MQTTQELSQITTRSIRRRLVERESTLRVKLITSENDAPRLSPLKIVEESACLLEESFFLAAFAEALHILNVTSFDELSRTEAKRLIELTETISRLSTDQIMPRIRDMMDDIPNTPPTTAATIEEMYEWMVVHVDGLIRVCPIADLESLGRKLHRENLAHRCRVAYNGLQAYCRRNGTHHDAAQSVVGLAYTEGRLSAMEAATLLGLEAADAAAWLEQNGYIREVTTITLTEDVRQQIYAKMRADRIQRKGQPAFSAEMVNRDVVASQRIEGIDARPWLPLLED